MNKKKPTLYPHQHVSNRAVLFAYSEVGYECLKTLLSLKADILTVFTHHDDPKEEIWFHSVADLAASVGIPIIYDSPISQTNYIAKLKPDLIFSFNYKQIIPENVLHCAKGGAFNIHGSLLPKLRGRAPVNWAIITGEKKTGVTLHHMTAEADKGDIVDQIEIDIAFEDTGISLFRKVVAGASTILRRSYPLIVNGTAPRQIQDESQASYFGKRTPEDGAIIWNQSALNIYNLIRAVTHPFPGAFAFLPNGIKVWIWSAMPVAEREKDADKAPGTVVSVDPLLIKTTHGLLQVRTLQLQGQAEAETAHSAIVDHIRCGDKMRS